MAGQFANNLSVARANAGLTQQEAADALGCTVQAYQNYEYGKRDIKGTTLAELADVFGCTVNYLLGLSDAISVHPASRRIPVLGRIAAGTPNEAIPQSDESWWLLDPTRADAGHLFYLQVSGDSMNRLFQDGTLLLIDPTEEVRNGDIGVVFVNGDDATVKRVFFAGDTVVLHPESTNPVHRDRPIDRTDPDAPEVRIVGKVVGFTSPEGWRA